jgi:hypothetical protein
VVRVPGYRSRGPGSFPGSTRISVKLKNYFKEKVTALVQKDEITAVGIRHADHETTLYP